MHIARDANGEPMIPTYEQEKRGCTPNPFELRERIERLELWAAKSGVVIELICKKLHPDAKLPAKAGKDEIGWDICCVEDDTFYEVNVQCQNIYGKSYPLIDLAVAMERYHQPFVVGDRFLVLYPQQSYTFHTGFACAIDQGYAMLLWDRSGMGAKKNIHRLAGVIDCTYRGEWLVCLTNLSDKAHVIKTGDKIVQGVIHKEIKGAAFWQDWLPASNRGEAGFGSTGS